MELLPQKLSVTIPVKLPEQRGINAVTPPHGVATSFRCTHDDLREIDAAIRCIDPTMSRGMFMRYAARYMADAVLQHILTLKEQANATKHGAVARQPDV